MLNFNKRLIKYEFFSHQLCGSHVKDIVRKSELNRILSRWITVSQTDKAEQAQEYEGNLGKGRGAILFRKLG